MYIESFLKVVVQFALAKVFKNSFVKRVVKRGIKSIDYKAVQLDGIQAINGVYLLLIFRMEIF